MKKTMLALVILVSMQAAAQSTKDILVGASFDLIKTDISRAFNKAQFGIEGHYFIVRHFAVGAGAELWTTGQSSSFMMGARYYATENLFVRLRGLIGANDAAVGVGYSYPYKDVLRIEAMGDYYFGGNAFALRVGAAYIFKSKK
jgi:hypothetical protein